MKYYNLKFKTENLQRKVELDTCTQNWKFSFKKILNLNNFKMKKKTTCKSKNFNKWNWTISSMQEQEGKSVELDFHWQKNPARSNLLSYFTEQSGWMLSVGLLVVHGRLLVDAVPHLLSWSNPWCTHTQSISRH